METQPKTDSRLRQIELSLRADHRFAVPLSDGYSVYSALLALLQSSDETTSARVHDSNIGSLHNSGLRGPSVTLTDHTTSSSRRTPSILSH